MRAKKPDLHKILATNMQPELPKLFAKSKFAIHVEAEDGPPQHFCKLVKGFNKLPETVIAIMFPGGGGLEADRNEIGANLADWNGWKLSTTDDLPFSLFIDFGNGSLTILRIEE